MILRRLLGCLMAAAISAPVVLAQDYKGSLPVDHPAIRYADGPTRDAVRLKLADFNAPLQESRAILADVLRRLDISSDSQMLVFSKTSVQAPKISPQRPRAIYFTDDVAVAYVPGTAAMEIAAVDPERGPIFYGVSLDGSRGPAISRGSGCLHCHHGGNTAGVPGLYVGSVIPGPSGAPLRDDTAIITDHRTAFRDRWGGWYVTAKRGQQPDRANAVVMDSSDPEALARESQQNVTSLAGRFDRSAYLAPTSDIVALMTFEHQTQMINLLTRVGWLARMAPNGGARGPLLDAALAKELDELVDYMLFVGEAPLTEQIEGVSSFAQTFAARGPRDGRGRSLREFDLKTRLFRYPLSYLLYSAQFDALPDVVRTAIYARLRAILSGTNQDVRYRHLSVDDRRALREILAETRPEFEPGQVRTGSGPDSLR